jgi:hypothetical protein
MEIKSSCLQSIVAYNRHDSPYFEGHALQTTLLNTSFNTNKRNSLSRFPSRLLQSLFLNIRPLDAQIIPFLDLVLALELCLHGMKLAHFARITRSRKDDESSARRKRVMYLFDAGDKGSDCGGDRSVAIESVVCGWRQGVG